MFSFGDPWVVDLEVEPDVTLFVDDRGLAGRQHDVLQAWLEAVPTRRERRRDVAHVLVVEQQHGSEACFFHLGVGALESPITHVGPVDALFPIGAQTEERFTHPLSLFLIGWLLMISHAVRQDLADDV